VLPLLASSQSTTSSLPNIKNVMARHKDVKWWHCHNKEATNKVKALVAAAGSATLPRG